MEEFNEYKRRLVFYDAKVFGAINRYWAMAVRFVRAKEFFAELLGTFMLIVSLTVYFLVCDQTWHCR